MLNLFVFGMELMGPDQQVDSFQLLMKCSFRHGREYEDEFIATPADQRIALTDISLNRCYNLGEYAVAKIMSVGIIDILEMVNIKHGNDIAAAGGLTVL